LPGHGPDASIGRFRNKRSFSAMRHSTWLKLESNVVWHGAYRAYRRLPNGWRAPIRWLLTPHWALLTALIRIAARQQVVAGPFKGTKLLLSAVSDRLLPSYILGSAELEIHRAIETLVARNYATILNIGAADGYYAVGFARRSLGSHIVAFEAVLGFHEVIARTAHANDVSDRIEIAGHCDRNALRTAIAQAKRPILIFSDIEGYETQLLDPIAVPELSSVDLFIETHDAVVPQCTALMIDRLRSTHQVERFVARQRVLQDFPDGFLPLLPKLFPRLALDVMNERRAGTQEWLYCESAWEGNGAVLLNVA
jgi:hypothetical protein